MLEITIDNKTFVFFYNYIKIRTLYSFHYLFNEFHKVLMQFDLNYHLQLKTNTKLSEL